MRQVAVTPQAVTPTDVSPTQLQQWLTQGKAVLVDVREPIEYAEERIAGSSPMPLSQFDASALRAKHPAERIVFHCKGGKRSAQACTRFAQPGDAVYHLAGGIDAWKAASLPTLKPEGAPRIPIMRQVLLTAGGLVVLGVLLGVAVSPWFLALAGFVGGGLIFAGATGWCGMAKLLAKMPWNKMPSPPS